MVFGNMLLLLHATTEQPNELAANSNPRLTPSYPSIGIGSFAFCCHAGYLLCILCTQS